MLDRRVSWTIVFLLVASVFGIAHAQAPAKSIAGTWVVVTAERQLDPDPELQGATVTFTNNSFKIERLGGRVVWFGNMTLDPAKGTIDLVHQAKLMIPPNFGAKWEGIFKLDGNNLEICTAEGYEARPTEFLSGYNLTLMKLRRK